MNTPVNATVAEAMEQARQDLLLLLLAEQEASALLIKQCLFHLSNGLDISEIVSDKTVNAIIVQAPDFVQLDLGQTVQYLLENVITRNSLLNLHFLPSFLIEVSGLFMAMTNLANTESSWVNQFKLCNGLGSK